MKRYLHVMMALALASACATDPSDDGSSGTEAETETGDDSMDEHGTVRVEVVPLGGDVSIFDGTAEVVATVHYESCLQALYLGNPELTLNGTEGAPIFEDWLDRLCADFEGTPVCSVPRVEQTLDPDNDVYSLQITYAILEFASLADSELHVGPLPTSDLAGCEARVELQQSGLIGRDINGVNIWRISTLPANNTAVTNQGAPLRVEVIRNDAP